MKPALTRSGNFHYKVVRLRPDGSSDHNFHRGNWDHALGALDFYTEIAPGDVHAIEIRTDDGENTMLMRRIIHPLLEE